MTKDEEIQEVLRKFEKLPPKAQSAFLWVVENISFLYELCKGPKIAKEKIDSLAEAALEKDDYMTYALILYKKTADQ